MSKLHEQMFDAGFKAGQEAALAEIARLRASNAELLEAAKYVSRSRLGPLPDVHCDLDTALDSLERAIANAEKEGT